MGRCRYASDGALRKTGAQQLSLPSNRLLESGHLEPDWRGTRLYSAALLLPDVVVFVALTCASILGGGHADGALSPPPANTQRELARLRTTKMPLSATAPASHRTFTTTSEPA